MGLISRLGLLWARLLKIRNEKENKKIVTPTAGYTYTFSLQVNKYGEMMETLQGG